MIFRCPFYDLYDLKSKNQIKPSNKKIKPYCVYHLSNIFVHVQMHHPTVCVGKVSQSWAFWVRTPPTQTLVHKKGVPNH